ncbi:methyltransferase domain-containing protein [Parvibaculum sp.]|uniref:methyltransferase domain-containing protein n=1 Tax=Parvibaculum sp. TaxID=2024848 RepID=UPI00320D0C28
MQQASTMLIFDRKLHAQRRARAAAGFAGHDFLVRRVVEEFSDRLMAVNRNFPLALDLGSHLGALIHAALPAGKIGALVATDLSPAMIARGSGSRLAADEEHLPFRDQSFDLIASALSLHWTNDLPGALVQIRRALVPDGLFLGAVFGGDTLTELRQSLAEAEIELEGGLSPRVSPFVELRDMGSLLQRAGFALPVVDSDRITVRYGNALKLMSELRGMGETNALIERRRTPLRRGTLLRAAEIYQQKFGLPDGRVEVTFEVIFMTGWSPHESQQKPLKPGSARMRLADALRGDENSKGD